MKLVLSVLQILLTHNRESELYKHRIAGKSIQCERYMNAHDDLAFTIGPYAYTDVLSPHFSLNTITQLRRDLKLL